MKTLLLGIMLAWSSFGMASTEATYLASWMSYVSGMLRLKAIRVCVTYVFQRLYRRADIQNHQEMAGQ
jgi:hypothetical protein